MSLPDKVPRQEIYCQTCTYGGWQRVALRKGKRLPRSFAISQQLAKQSQARKFESKITEKKKEVKKVLTMSGYQPFYEYMYTREWVERGTGELILTDSFLKQYEWRWTGHFNTYFGKDYKTLPRKSKPQKSNTVESK